MQIGHLTNQRKSIWHLQLIVRMQLLLLQPPNTQSNLLYVSIAYKYFMESLYNRKDYELNKNDYHMIFQDYWMPVATAAPVWAITAIVNW